MILQLAKDLDQESNRSAANAQGYHKSRKQEPSSCAKMGLRAVCRVSMVALDCLAQNRWSPPLDRPSDHRLELAHSKDRKLGYIQHLAEARTQCFLLHLQPIPKDHLPHRAAVQAEIVDRDVRILAIRHKLNVCKPFGRFNIARAVSDRGSKGCLCSTDIPGLPGSVKSRHSISIEHPSSVRPCACEKQSFTFSACQWSTGQSLRAVIFVPCKYLFSCHGRLPQAERFEL